MTDRITTLEEEAALRVSQSPLEEFAEVAKTTREAFITELDSLPPPLDSVAKRSYIERVRQGNGRAVLGEYAPWLIADLCGLGQSAVSPEFLLAWLDIYSYIVFIDAAIDEASLADRSFLLIASGLLLERGIARLGRLSLLGDEMLTAADTYLTETAVAAVKELAEHRSRVQDYSDAAIGQLGSKVAALKLCARYVVLQDPEARLGDLPVSTVDQFCTGIQLLDDITDWEEDWKAGNNTLPLTLTRQRLAARGTLRALKNTGLSRDELLVGLLVTEALEESLGVAIGHLEDSMNTIGRIGTDGSATGRFLRMLLGNCRWCVSALRSCRESVSAVPSEASHDYLASLSSSPQGRRAAALVATVLPVVAQSS